MGYSLDKHNFLEHPVQCMYICISLHAVREALSSHLISSTGKAKDIIFVVVLVSVCCVVCTYVCVFVWIFVNVKFELATSSLTPSCFVLTYSLPNFQVGPSHLQHGFALTDLFGLV